MEGGHYGVVLLLMRSGARLGARSWSDGRTETELIHAARTCHVPILDALTRHATREEIDARDASGQPALGVASEVGCDQAVRLLLAAHASTDGAGEWLARAARRGHSASALLMVRAGVPADSTDGGWMALQWALANGDFGLAREIAISSKTERVLAPGVCAGICCVGAAMLVLVLLLLLRVRWASSRQQSGPSRIL